MSLQAIRYAAVHRDAWNTFVAGSRNGTFLLDRDFMEYHADRFVDHSLLFMEGEQLIAVLPANQVDSTLYSHQGLTYGGLLVGPRSGSSAMLGIMACLVDYLGQTGLVRLVYKTIPWIYHRIPAEEDRYALFRNGATLIRRDVLSVIPRGARAKPQERRVRGAKSARKAGVEIVESTEFAPFWDVLDQNLRERFGVGPVHTLDEIQLLHRWFPDRIRLFEARHAGQTVAGVVVFETDTVAHIQYISANDSGRDLHALDLLFTTLIEDVFAEKPYIDFGISNEDDGRLLNEGLVAQKEGFGARSVVHDYYEVLLSA